MNIQLKLLQLLLKFKYQIVLFLIVIFYAVFYAPYGTDDVDNGYTMALSWRIFNGEIPYRDFIMVRPPLSPLFHTLTLYVIPENFQVIFERIFTYILFAISSLLGALSIDKIFDLKKLQLNTYLLAIIGFVFSVRNYPAMPWHTIDGVFFGSIGIYLLIKYNSYSSIFWGILFLFFSALCKQSFYLMPLLGSIYILSVQKNWKKTIFAIISLVVFLAIFLAILKNYNILNSFVALTSGSTNLKDLIIAGILSYFDVNAIYFILPFLVWIFLNNHSEKLFSKKKTYLTPYFFISFLLLYPIMKFFQLYFFKTISYDTFFPDSVPQLLFIITLFYIVINFSLKKEIVGYCLLILLSWCAGLSWGFRTPVMFSTPLIFGFFLISKQYFDLKNVKYLAIYTLLLGGIAYGIEYQKPYRNPMRNELVYKVDYLFPKLSYIKVSKDTHDKYIELHGLIQKYGKNFKTLPGIPLANYFSNTNSPISIDWVFNAETNNNNDQIIKKIINNRVIVFMEKNPQIITSINNNEKFNSLVSFYIKFHCNKIDSTKYFDVYQSYKKI